MTAEGIAAISHRSILKESEAKTSYPSLLHVSVVFQAFDGGGEVLPVKSRCCLGIQASLRAKKFGGNLDLLRENPGRP